MQHRPRTSADFNLWFEQAGDPWGYQSVSVRERLTCTAQLLVAKLGAEFSGNFIEIGAYDGSFTCLLAETFPKSRIVVNDISEVALERARTAVARHSGMSRRTQFLLKDSISISVVDIYNGFVDPNRPSVILLLKCLYYLKREERENALRNLCQLFPAAVVAISAPIVGGDYFTEDELISMFGRQGYSVLAVKTLNLRRLGRFRFLRAFADRNAVFRRTMGNQVLYLFHQR